MNAATRRTVLAAASSVSRESRYSASAPVLTLDSPKEQVERWLQWCDPNGIHITRPGHEGGYDTLDDAWEALAAMAADT